MNIKDIIELAKAGYKPNEVKELIEKKGDASVQEATFGFTGQQVYDVQKDGRNGFALVGSKEEIDINNFLSLIGEPADYSDYIL